MVPTPQQHQEEIGLPDELSPLLGESKAPNEAGPLSPPNGITLPRAPRRKVARGFKVACGLAIASALGLLGVLSKSRLTRAGRPPLRSQGCSESGPSPCVVRPAAGASAHIGDPSRPGFASRTDSNLALFDDFTAEGSSPSSRRSLGDLWRPDVTLGDGNGGFAYYTADEANVAVEDGELRIRPGLFADLGRVRTGARNVTHDAGDVMLGNCNPFPECATFSIPEETCTEPNFSGCRRIGTPLVALNPATSGRVSTRGTFDFAYGRLEARIRLPRGDWLWPALWLMPSEDYYGAWPDSGEIDLVEARGNGPGFRAGGRDGGRDVFVTSLHYAGNCWWHTQKTARASELLGSEDFSDDFFTMGFYWSDVRMYSYVRDAFSDEERILWDVNASAGFGPDDAPLGCRLPPAPRARDEHEQTLMEGNGPYSDVDRNRNAPFDRPFHIILNVAVGGEQNGCPDPGFWGENAIWCTRRDPEMPEVAASTVFWNSREEWLPTWEDARFRGRESFAIDWVKVWQ